MPKKTPPASSTVSPDAIPREVFAYWQHLRKCEFTPYFDARTVARGLDYAGGGKVESLWATADGFGLLAKVAGTCLYTTGVTLKPDRRQKGTFKLDAYCSCPVEEQCKHSVAAIIRFLYLMAEGNPIPRCVALGEDCWQVSLPSGKTRLEEIVGDEYGMGEHGWDEEDGRRSGVPCRKNHSKKAAIPAALKKKLEAMTVKDLVAVIAEIYARHEGVRMVFQQAECVRKAAENADPDVIVRQAVRLIDTQFDRCDDFCYHGPHDNNNPLDLRGLAELIRQCANIDFPLAVIAPISRHYVQRCNRCVETSGVDDLEDVMGAVFDEMTAVLLASKPPATQAILWASEMTRLDMHYIGMPAFEKMLDRRWSRQAWSAAADALLAEWKGKQPGQRDQPLLCDAMDAMDKAGRRNNAVAFLRQNAASRMEWEMLVDRLLEQGKFKEAKTLLADMPEYSNYWRRYGKQIAEKEEDWPTLASILAEEFFHDPHLEALWELLHAAMQMHGEAEVAAAVEKFLETGVYPAAIKKTRAGKKLTAVEAAAWPVPVYPGGQGTRLARTSRRYDLLCAWAMEDGRAADALRWYEKYERQEPPKHFIASAEVAEAVLGHAPDEALRIYRRQAEHEMEVTRRYPEAARLLRRIRQILETLGREATWAALLADIRERHRRKPRLMRELNSLERLSD